MFFRKNVISCLKKNVNGGPKKRSHSDDSFTINKYPLFRTAMSKWSYGGDFQLARWVVFNILGGDLSTGTTMYKHFGPHTPEKRDDKILFFDT